MSEDGVIEVSKITIVRTISPDGTDGVIFDTEGDPTYLELLGLLSFVQHSLWQSKIEDEGLT